MMKQSGPISVLIFETAFAGHRANYVSNLARGLVKLGIPVTITVTENQRCSVEYKTYLSELESDVSLIYLKENDQMSVLGNAKYRFREFRNALAPEKYSNVYVPYADGLTQAWGACLRPRAITRTKTTIEGILMRGTFAYPADSLKRRVASFISWQAIRRASFDRLHILDPLVMKFIEQNDSRLGARCERVPEAIETHVPMEATIAKMRLGASSDGHLLCCPGGVEVRKGATELLQAFASISNSTKCQLLLIGKHDTATAALLANEYKDLVAKKRILSIDRFASVEEFQLSFDAADIICVPYPRHIGVASILLKAAAMRKKIIASNWGWVGWAVENYRLGNSCDVSNVSEFGQSILQTIEGTSPRISEADSEAIRSENSVENHVMKITSLLRKRLQVNNA